MGNIHHKKDQYFWHFVSMVIFGTITAIAFFILHKIDRIPIGISSLDAFILSFATFRLIRLFAYDLITDFIRDFFTKYTDGPGKSISDLLNCPWCIGIWIALPVAFFYFLTPLAWPVIFFIALAGAGTLLSIFSSLLMQKIEK